jgi:hypothetical protein
MLRDGCYAHKIFEGYCILDISDAMPTTSGDGSPRLFDVEQAAATLTADGYVVVPDFLSQAHTAELRRASVGRRLLDLSLCLGTTACLTGHGAWVA